MNRSLFAMAVAALLLASSVQGAGLLAPSPADADDVAATADDVPPDPEAQYGLSRQTVALMWSHDVDDPADPSGSESFLQLANATDVSYKEPPAAASVWSENDHLDLTRSYDLQDRNRSVVPPDAASARDFQSTFSFSDGTQGGLNDHWGDGVASAVVLRDAHSTIFGVHPSTIGHVSPDERHHYVRPNGSIRSLVDYRVVVPEGQDQSLAPGYSDDTAVDIEWEFVESEIVDVTLLRDGVEVDPSNDNGDYDADTNEDGHLTVYEYQEFYGRDTSLVVRATINVTLERSVTTRQRDCTYYTPNNSTNFWDCDIDTTSRSEAVTISHRPESDPMAVRIYNLKAYPYYAEYPGRDSGVVVFQSRPWQGLSFDGTPVEVTGNWRFYTGRDTDWDTVQVRSRTGSDTRTSVALPSYVHAFPSATGATLEPSGNQSEILDVWGSTFDSPASNVASTNVNVDIAQDSYEPSYGVAIRADDISRDRLRVHGIVRGEEAYLVNLSNVDASVLGDDVDIVRDVNRSNVTVEVVPGRSNDSHTTLHIELMDNQTGDPIDLREQAPDPLRGPSVQNRSGYLAVNGERVRMDEPGVANVTLNRTGRFNVRYEPGSWLRADPAYTGDSAVVKHRSIDTLGELVDYVTQVLLYGLPLLLVLFVAKNVLRKFGRTRGRR
ncbi:hypothetical protein [Haloarchaeobius iranensis]|uniref:Uncharacterized protein n=1 Tax=Haloarchaeobius iranensis TaxID=996166 RepID=A0A1G9UG76_9EURY|nr:hypothetical protein [Haloarchaeobius iranensis]SDM58813.1 hypothetical protein SAMN05192554_104106 [Haloarchaeobius iranensis]